MESCFQAIDKTAELHSRVRPPRFLDAEQKSFFEVAIQPAGNLATQRLFRSGALRAKLAISQPGDPYEQEADRVANHVMRMSESSLQRTCAACESDATPCPECEADKAAQRKPEASAKPIGTSVPDSFVESLGSGQPLDSGTRAFFEPRLGRDLGEVRVHSDTRAVESARAINAAAYSVGRDIVLGMGEHSMGASEGKKLLAHELTHVIQQSSGGGSLLQRTCSQNADESFYQTAANYCKDTGFSGMLHPGQRCYREVPRRKHYWECPPGDQVCFDKEGKCHDSYDRASTVEKKESDGTCNLHGLCFVKHAVLDIIPGIFQEGADEQARERVECMDSCKNLDGFARSSCEVECIRSSRLMP